MSEQTITPERKEELNRRLYLNVRRGLVECSPCDCPAKTRGNCVRHLKLTKAGMISARVSAIALQKDPNVMSKRDLTLLAAYSSLNGKDLPL